METGEGAAMLLLEESVQRMEKLAKSMEELGRRVKRTEKHSRRWAEELARRVKRAERLALRKEKHARRSAEELARRAKSMERLPLNKKHGRRLAEKRAKMELPATKQFAEKEESVKMELPATVKEESVKMELPATVEFAEMEENLKMWRAMGEMEMEIVREELELQARRMGKPVADAGSEEGKPVADAGSKQGKRKRTRMVRLNQARVESAVPFRRPPYPVPPMPDWMLALAPEEIRKEELEMRAFVAKIQAIDEDFYTQYRLKGYVEVKVTEEVPDDEPGVQE
ncbi:eukaryotic translation initiation factor 4 gamma-like isoform X2 [Panicum virgatum]|uniref:eukaryotic translation initiation factor 4 gamma-like isoform X2 n=1 Tax=Panicum virgatum TaxID=38727 RepID=UPI0019D55EFD|nr:eukaryotic translation initiation factor 4 gamma-like isoform X2 [Panicum virgatum]